MSAAPSQSPEQLLREQHREQLRGQRIRKFETYRSEDKHECGLLVNRSASLLTSQAFLVTAVAVFYRPASDHLDGRFPILIASLALLIAISASFAICIGCRVLEMWHDHGRALILEDTGAGRAETDPPADNFLHGLYLPLREQPDWRHKMSIDVFHVAMPIIFGIAWAVFLWFNTYRLGRIAVGTAVGVWLLVLRLVWVKAYESFDPKPETLGNTVISTK